MSDGSPTPTCHVSCVTCLASHTCHVSCVTCHLIFFVNGHSFEAIRCMVEIGRLVENNNTLKCNLKNLNQYHLCQLWWKCVGPTMNAKLFSNPEDKVLKCRQIYAILLTRFVPWIGEKQSIEM